MATTFEALGVPAPIADARAARGLTAAFPIRAQTISHALRGRDVDHFHRSG